MMGADRDEWSKLPLQELLDLRICDLELEVQGSHVEGRLLRLDEELQAKGIRFRPYTWFSSAWFTPDGLTGFAIPFYLAHPRLVRLERRMMLRAEGSGRDECMRILRHETAHALDNAHGLRRRRGWRDAFGRAGAPYRQTYRPDPTSQDHVLNLGSWYSQSHPLEDWAETFAVWLQPGSRWRKRYARWPALRKLEYVDELMEEVAGKPPKRRTRRQEEPVGSLQLTLREYYERKRQLYRDEGTPAFDGQLLQVFPATGSGTRAVTFLRKHRRELVERVSRSTDQHPYLLDHVLGEMIARCKGKDARLCTSSADALVDAAIVLTSLSSQYLYGGHPDYQR